MAVTSVYHLTSVHNPKIKRLLQLQKEQIKSTVNQFVAEGEHFCQLANNQQRLQSLWITETRYAKLTWTVHSTVKIYVISEAIAQKISQVVQSSGILGICLKPTPKSWATNNLLILDNLQDPGNLGTLMRSAAAFDFLTVVTSPDSVSFYNPKVLRATQGLIFVLNLITTDLAPLLMDLKQQNYQLIGTFIHQPGFLPTKFSHQPKALLIGNEGQGLNQRWLKLIDYNLMIPMNPQVESLNAAIAGSIIMYQLKQTSEEHHEILSSPN